MSNGDSVVGYVRVSTDEQGSNGSGIESQREAVRRSTSGAGTLVRIEEDVQSAKSLRKRLGLQRALEAVESAEAAAPGSREARPPLPLT